jgi:hypothetical protein
VAAPDGAQHVAKGMVDVFDVKGSKSSLKAPKNVQDVTLTDTKVTVPAGDAPSKMTVKVTNEGTKPHSWELVKLNTGKTLADAYTYFNSLINTGKATGTAPGVLVGGVGSLAANGVAYAVLDLPAGHYGYLSTDGAAPNDDYTKGLKGEFDVK